LGWCRLGGEWAGGGGGGGGGGGRRSVGITALIFNLALDTAKWSPTCHGGPSEAIGGWVSLRTRRNVVESSFFPILEFEPRFLDSIALSLVILRTNYPDS